MAGLQRYDPVFSFSESLASYPGRTAIFIQKKEYSYAELAGIVHFIYTLIPSDKKYDRIGVYCNNDIYTYASLLAINLYGAAYVPLNSKYPQERNRKMAEHCELELVLNSADEMSNDLFSSSINIISTVPPDQKTLQKISDHKLAELCSLARKEYPEDSIAYILYTSGSTGQPKAVSVSHGNVNAFFNWFRVHYDFSEKDKFLQVYELSFDVSVFSFFMPLMCGATCYVLPEEGIRPMKIVEEIRKREISVCSMVPSVLDYLEKYMSEIELPSLRYSFFSGDALHQHLAKKWKTCLPNGVIHNFYGPTETTIVCTRYVFNEKTSEEGIVPLGKAFKGMEFMILDENRKEAQKGELCFSGVQVIRSYLNNEDEEKFFEYNGKRFYRTGDIVSMNANADLIFHGRTDQQVKINGHRVELGEVEAIVSEVTGTKSTAVFVRKDQRLYVFIDSDNVDVKMLKKKLGELLPLQMLPHKLIPVKNWPLNLNGKVDKPQLLTYL